MDDKFALSRPAISMPKAGTNGLPILPWWLWCWHFSDLADLVCGVRSEPTLAEENGRAFLKVIRFPDHRPCAIFCWLGL